MSQSVGTPDYYLQATRIDELERTLNQLRRSEGDTEGGAIDLDDHRVLQDVGIYHYHHPLENASAYKEALDTLKVEIADMVRGSQAVEVSDRFTFGNSLAQGRKLTKDLSKLMLRAYNAEADNAMRTMRAGALPIAVKRLATAAAAIEKLGSLMQMKISRPFQNLRVKELELTQDYLMMLQEEKEKAREERERLREERKVQAELKAERERLAKEREHYANVLRSLRESGDEQAAAEMAERLSSLDIALQQNDVRSANIRAGYVYVISNVGALGHDVVKIGLTRRLDPMERVAELGGASVPFPFDVHALYFSDDAVTLETQLHHAFSELRVNHANLRREFFFATPSQVRAILEDKVGNLLEFTEQPEATQYFQSLAQWPVAQRESGR